MATKNIWLLDKAARSVRHSINGLTLTIECGEVVNIENLSSVIKLGTLPSLLHEGLLAYKNAGEKENKSTKEHTSNRPVLCLKKNRN